MKPRVVVLSLSSDFGCQVQISNYPQLLDMISTFQIGYWQLVLSGDMPAEYEVALIEGAVTTTEQIALLEKVRATASCVIAIGACAVTGGVPGLARRGVMIDHFKAIYGADKPPASEKCVAPAPVSAYIPVDFLIPGCPIEPEELSRVLQRALRALVDNPQRQSMCGECKMAENTCFWTHDTACLGLIARSGCHATCVSRGRPCTACRGIAYDANLDAARQFAASHGCEEKTFDGLIDLYNAAREIEDGSEVTS